MSNVYLLIALVESQELGEAGWRLRISPTWYSPEDFAPKRSVFIDDACVFTVTSKDLDEANIDYDAFAKYVVVDLPGLRATLESTYPGS